MHRLLARTPLSLLLAAPLFAQAVSITAGTSEYVTFRDCVPGATACDSISPIRASQYGGSPGAYSSASTQNAPGYGSASGSVSFSGVIGAPVLHASASSEAGKRANTKLVTIWDDGTDLTPAVTSLPVPEPAPLALFGLGLAVLAAARRRQPR